MKNKKQIITYSMRSPKYWLSLLCDFVSMTLLVAPLYASTVIKEFTNTMWVASSFIFFTVSKLLSDVAYNLLNQLKTETIIQKEGEIDK